MTGTFVRAAVVLALLTSAPAAAGPIPERAPETARTVTKKVTPVYPDVARNGQLEGTVKLSVLVTVAGKVKKVDVIGGHPVFVLAARNAAMLWRFEPADRESSETLVFSFEPPR